MELPLPPPPATTNTSVSTIPDGTLNVPDVVNDSDVGSLDVIEKERELVLDAASTALNTKLKTVVELVEESVPAIIAVPPSAAVFVILYPGGNEPDCNSNVTLPADSGSVAINTKRACRTYIYNTY